MAKKWDVLGVGGLLEDATAAVVVMNNPSFHALYLNNECYKRIPVGLIHCVYSCIFKLIAVTVNI